MAATKSDYYAVLHVSHDAPTEIIRASYQTLMQKLKRHPDLGGEASLAAVDVEMTPEWWADISALSYTPAPATDRSEIQKR